MTRLWIKALPLFLVGVLIQFAVEFLLDDAPPDMRLLAIPTLFLPTTIWLFIAPLVYLCVVLAGGVMGRKERSRR